MRKRGHKKNRKVVGLEKLVFHPTSYNCKQSSILVKCIHSEKNNTFTKFPKEFERAKFFPKYASKFAKNYSDNV